MLKLLVFESDFFGIKFAELNNLNVDKQQFMQYDCIQYKSCDKNEHKKLQHLGFAFEDSRKEFSKRLNLSTTKYRHEVRQANISDIDRLSESLISPLTEYSRYLSVVGYAKCLEFYTVWANKAILATFDDLAFIVEKENSVVGFISLKVDENNASIGLLSVHRDYQSQGIASALIAHVDEYLYSLGIRKVEVATEGKNSRALDFYKNNGFTVEKTVDWYYWRK